MLKIGLLVALLAYAPVPQDTAGPQQSERTAKESESGHRYPIWVESTLRTADLESDDVEPVKLDLLGMAIREKWIINVYSYALYVDQAFVGEALAPWRGKSRKKIEKDKALFAKLLEQNATKELRLRFCRDVNADDIVSAFEESLEPRILERRRKQSGSKDEKLKELKTFRGFFDLDELQKGNELRFTWHPDGTLSTVVNGVRKPDVPAGDLSWALFDVYLGADPISSSGKKRLVRGLAK
ncbi:MAG: chalcone isomerase family protein [Planctomycetota bacterium]